MSKMNTNEKSPATPHFLVREELPSGVVNVKPRFGSYLNYIFSNMSKQDKIRLLKKSEEDQIDELKELYKEDFMKQPIETQQDILKQLTYNNSQYDQYKLAEYLPKIQLAEKGKKEEGNIPKVNPRQHLLFISQQLLQSQPGKYNQYEMEVKFGTRGVKRLTKQDWVLFKSDRRILLFKNPA